MLGKRWIYLLFFASGIGAVILFNTMLHVTATDDFCQSCHVHPHATQSWKLSTHYDNDSGMPVHCVQCHLPPEGIRYISEKAKLGIRDAYGTLFKETDKINWDEKSALENAVHYSYKASCLHCHENLFPSNLSTKGEDAHLYYQQNEDKLRCLNCHLHVGHYNEEAQQTEFTLTSFEEKKEIYQQPARIDSFRTFTETIPGTFVSFKMVAIPGGTLSMGSPAEQAFRDSDEGPQHRVHLTAFWMAEHEVSWDEYLAFYQQTSGSGRSEDQVSAKANGVDAITGPTPPYGNPGQGWGRGQRPAITMTHYAAERYCQWLSRVTGKSYRLPTEAEWEYACRGGTQTPYFFSGEPKDYSNLYWWNRWFGTDTSVINTYVNYALNSDGKTALPQAVAANPFGLLHMAGNVREFCRDWYQPDTYEKVAGEAVIMDPAGPGSGDEHVIRGGSYRRDAAALRAAARDHTRNQAWMITDPQIPKSLWWYSDCRDVGFRVVLKVSEQ
jgi:formylglycine-generating enzyme